MSTIKFSEKTYSILKWLAMIVLPAVAVLYTAMNNTWGTLPYPVEVVKTITAIDAFLGILLGVSTYQYNKASNLSSFSETTIKVNTPIGISFLSNETYDFLKAVAQMYLPAIGTLYFALATTWGLPNPDQAVATIIALDAFLGMILDFGAQEYKN